MSPVAVWLPNPLITDNAGEKQLIEAIKLHCAPNQQQQ